jgi:hypothetical protein
MNSDSIKWLRAGPLRLLEPVKKRLNSCWMDLGSAASQRVSADAETRGFGMPGQSRARRQFLSHQLFLTVTEIFQGPASVAQTSLIWRLC